MINNIEHTKIERIYKMKELEEDLKITRRGRTKIGEGTRRDKRSTSFSKRALMDKLEVITENFKCPYCHHHKALQTKPELGKGIKKCARCKRKI